MGVFISDSLDIISHDAVPGKGKQFPVRALAYVLDALAYYSLTAVTAFCAGLFLVLVFAIFGQDFQVPHPAGLFNFLYSAVLLTLYFFLCEWLFGATPGKLVLRMCVVSIEGRPCSWRAGLVRGLYRWCDGLFFAIPALTTMKWPLYQRIGDKVARTVVIAARDLAPQARRSGWWLVLALFAYVCLSGVGTSLWWLGLTAMGLK